MTEEIRSELVKVANHLAEIQIEGVTDLTGFSNADKTVGAHLAAIVAFDPSNVEALGALASLCGVKYQRQVAGLVGEKMLAEFKKLARGSKITPEQRAEAKLTVIAQPDVHPKFGARVLLSFMFNQDFSYALRDLGCKPFHGPDGWKWVVPMPKVETAIATLKARGAKIVGKYDATNVKPVEPARSRTVRCIVQGKRLVLSFDYHKDTIEAIKTLPERRYDAETRTWTVPSFRAAELLHALTKVHGIDVSEVEAAVSSVHPASNGTTQPEESVVVDFARYDKNAARDGKKMRDFQRVGIEFLTQPLTPVREELSPNVRGLILGDDMGMGKTAQSIIGADAVAKDGETVLVVCPATLTLQWRREITLWTGCSEDDVHIIHNPECKACGHGEGFHAPGSCVRMLDENDKPIDKITRTVERDGRKVQERIVWHCCDCTVPTQNGFDASKRWNVISYDILDTHYDALEAIGFDVLIVDEAHYAKNRESARSRFIVGGRVTMLQRPNPRDGAAKRARMVDGLSVSARRRVFLLTGTPMTSRTRDTFNLLRAAGHPLGRNFRQFAMRYCDPQLQIGRTGRVLGTTYNGSSNIEELRERIAPIFLQRKKEDYLHELPGMQRDWRPVEIELGKYRAIMAEYEARRKAGELKSSGDHLALMTEARVCVALAKTKRTIELIESKVEQGAKVIVFSVYDRVVQEVAKHFGDHAVVLNGKMTTAQKEAAKKRFAEDPSITVLVGNYMNGQGAAVGHNITVASAVIFNDLDWVPANMEQAWCRAYRMGQKSFVHVIFLLAAGTFDEDMSVLLEEKFKNVTTFENRQNETLFNDLIARLAAAPQNAEAKALFEARSRAKQAA